MSFPSEDSQDWPTPPSSAAGTPVVVEDIETYFTSEAQKADQVMVESFTTTERTDDEAEDKLSLEDFPISPPEMAKVIPYEDTAYLMSSAFEDKDFGADDYQHDTAAATCLSSTLNAATCLSNSFNVSCSSSSPKGPRSTSLRKDSSAETVIMAQPTRSPAPRSPLSEEEVFSNDEVFMPGTIKVQLSPDETKTQEYIRKLSRGSNNSDTSIDDILSPTTGTVRHNYEHRLSSGSCRKCSHSSHSEEDTSSIGTDLDGTVRMGMQKKCTHSSHSEDTSIGLSISDWSTGTNTVRQYANLSGSDSLSAVSNLSCAKSEKSNQTRSSLSSINKSAESLCDNGSSDGLRYDMLSSSETDKMSDTTSATKSDDTTLTLTEMAQTMSEWSTSSSRTLVGPAPGDVNDQMNGRRASYIDYQPLKYHKAGSREKNEEEKRGSLPQIHRRSSSNGLQRMSNEDLAQKSTTSDDMAETTAARKRRSLEMMSKRYQSQELCSESESFVERLYAPSEKLTERYQSQEFVPLHGTPGQPPATAPKPVKGKAPQPPQAGGTKPKAPQPPPKPTKPKMSVTQPLMQALLRHMKEPGVAEAAAAQAAAEEEAAAAEKQKQAEELKKAKPPPPPIPPLPPITSPTDLPETEIGPPGEKPLAKHHSYDDKTLSKSQIREYKTNKVRQSNSFHEHMLTQSQQSSIESMPASRIDEELNSTTGGGGGAATSSSFTSTTTTTTINSGNTTSNETNTTTSSPMLPSRAEKLIKCSPYYSSSLSSESPPNQLIQKPPRKGSISRTAPIIKSPPSGNDTDSSVDVRTQDPKLRTRGYRKKRQITAKRVRSSERNLVEQESSECSEGYMPEMDSGGSDPSYRHSEYYEFDEELEEREQETDEYDDYPQYSGVAFSSTSSAFESLDMTADNVDEMGFPRYDRLSHITNPIYQQQSHQFQQTRMSAAAAAASSHHHHQGGGGGGSTGGGGSSASSSSSRPAPANHPMPPPSGQPIKPARTKKRQLKREDSVMGSQSQSSAAPYGSGSSGQYHGRSYCNPEESEFETKGGLSDDMANSSEDSNNSFYHCTGTIKRSTMAAMAAAAAAANKSAASSSGSSTASRSVDCGAAGGTTSSGSVRDLDLPYPDFLSDYETEPIEYERFACGLDIRVDPPPKFHDSDDLSDQ
ncbi:serine-rich adhesin for platelets-like [Musca vetustissima]|uniref:serine-rich adhesin for platelets-like n=1 Tax=Musca vetustissima TaxID=27455 RepID=UPI002AB6D2DC|nr:serine-rich adhesin for platelets-like [Musca vetustissima]